MRRAWLCVLSFACAPAADRVALTSGAVEVGVELATGEITISRDGRPLLHGARADVLVLGEARPRFLAGPLEALGDGRFEGASGELELVLSLAVEGERVTAELEVVNRGDAPVTIARLTPLAGQLGLDAPPERLRILENGRAIFFDQTAQIVTGDAERFALADALTIPLRGASISNWSHAVVSADDPSDGWVAGFLGAELAVPTLGYSPREWAAECALVHRGKTIAPNASVRSETLWIAPGPPDPLEALEGYGRAIAAHLGLTPWTARDGGRAVPNGWNSWSGGSGSGGHGQRVTQAIYADATARLADALGEFGLSHMQLDDGWQAETGDWEFRRDRFPEGAAGVTRVARARGLAPGLWIAPFLAARGSTTAREHPEWTMSRVEGIAGLAAKDGEALDPSSADVRSRLRALGQRMKDDGFAWVKLDFAYFSLLGELKADPTLTQLEAQRLAWRAFREGLGPEAFLLGVGVVGGQLGLADGMRLTLDAGPRWEEDSPDGLASGGSLKATVRTGARRWFYAGAFVPHPDLLFFRSWPDAQHPALSFEEARAFASWVGLTGGIVKIGDRMDDLFASPANVDVVRRLLPAHPVAARPVDLLERDYPERFELALPAHRVVGLFHWGNNRDLKTLTPLGEAPREHRVRCDSPCHVYSFWDGAYLGVKEGEFVVPVEARRATVLALVPASRAPTLVGTARQIVMGDLDRARYDAAARALSLELDGAIRGTPEHPWRERMAVWLPEGEEIARVDGAEDVEIAREGPIARVSFRALARRVDLRLR